MKTYILAAAIFLFALASCSGGSDDQAAEAEMKVEIEKIEKVNQSLEETTTKIEEKTQALDAALEELDSI